MAFAYTARVGYLQRAGPFDVELAIVPVGRVWVVRDLVGRGFDSDAELHFYVHTQGGQTYTLAIWKLASGESRHLDLRQALPAGDSIRVGYTGTAGTNLAVTVYDLTV